MSSPTPPVIKSYLQRPKTRYASNVMHVHLSHGQRFRQSVWRDGSTGGLCHLGIEHSPGAKGAYFPVEDFSAVSDEVVAAFRGLGPDVCQSLGIAEARFDADFSVGHRLPNLSAPG